MLKLKDLEGRDRVALQVRMDESGTLPFLDINGKVESQIPPATNSPQKIQTDASSG